MITLDDLDHRILHALQDQADRSNLEIARLIGLSPAATLRRIKRLKDRSLRRLMRRSVAAGERPIRRAISKLDRSAWS